MAPLISNFLVGWRRNLQLLTPTEIIDIMLVVDQPNWRGMSNITPAEYNIKLNANNMGSFNTVICDTQMRENG